MGYPGALQSSHKETSTARLPAIVLIVLGIASLFLPEFAGISISVVFGMVIMVAGVACGSLAFAAFRTRTFLSRLLVGLAFALVGLDLLIHPGMALATVTLIVAITFAFEGFMEVASYLAIRHLTGSSYLLLNGLCSLLLALLIWRNWPTSSAWAIGTLIGINLITSGLTRFSASSKMHVLQA